MVRYHFLMLCLIHFGLNAYDYHTISNDQLYAQLPYLTMKNRFFYLINVLPDNVYKDCNIPGSINIACHKLEKYLKRWPKQRKIVVYSSSPLCPLAHNAYQKLQELGFSNVQLLQGGISDWMQHGYPVQGACKAGYLKLSHQKSV